VKNIEFVVEAGILMFAVDEVVAGYMRSSDHKKRSFGFSTCASHEQSWLVLGFGHLLMSMVGFVAASKAAE